MAPHSVPYTKSQVYEMLGVKGNLVVLAMQVGTAFHWDCPVKLPVKWDYRAILMFRS